MIARPSRFACFVRVFGNVFGPFSLRLESHLAQWVVVPTRLPSLRRPPIGFAHRGARAHAPENTLEAFRLAARLGATGLESDVWLTADGEAVLDHDGVVRQGVRKRPISGYQRADLPDHIPTLAELYADVGTTFELSLDVKDAAAFDRVIEVARAAGPGVLERLWLCHHRTSQVAEWRQRCAEVRLVDSTFLGHMPEGPERRAAELAAAGVDAVNLHHSEWSGGLTTLFHRFGVLCFGWDAQHDRILNDLLDVGLDAVYSDHVDRMVEALKQAE
jgi:glycerophosphoryl diester phosphodiesterase